MKLEIPGHGIMDRCLRSRVGLRQSHEGLDVLPLAQVAGRPDFEIELAVLFPDECVHGRGSLGDGCFVRVHALIQCSMYAIE